MSYFGVFTQAAAADDGPPESAEPQSPGPQGDAMTPATPPARAALAPGAARGTGGAAALKLAGRGLAVFVAADGREAELAATVEACRAAGARDAAHGVVDLQRPGEAERLVETARARLGRIDVLVNNAGIRCRKRFGEFTRDDFERVVAVNLAAAFFASQAGLPAMRAQGGGRIIHVASQLR